ncbi:MAG TPA: DnaB-like helicase C-terminal domain-containing protein [Candidatus Bipolaricaulis anaerobius]|nr:DnaB-like helicase C-terminal domain-containing protein [Candidatus Bipolaricaulis anaerobius]
MRPDRAPHDRELEASVLGAALLDPVALFDVIDVLDVDDFYLEPHRLVFEWIEYLANEGKPVDLGLLTNALREHGLLEKVGGASAIANLVDYTPDVASARFHAEALRDLSTKRSLLTLAGQITAGAQTTPGAELLDSTMAATLDIAGKQERGETVKAGEAVAAVGKQSLEIYNHQAESVVLRTGIAVLDERVFLRHGQMVIVAGTTSSGKTALALQIADNVARRGRHVHFFSFEMGRAELAARLLSARAGVYVNAIESGTYDDLARDKIDGAVREARDLSLWIDDTPSLTPLDIRARARQTQLRHGLDLVVVDYLQLVTPPTKSRNRVQEVDEISRALKLTARALGVPVIVCAQLSRKHLDGSRAPELHDLRESGAIENDADVVLMLDRKKTTEEAKALTAIVYVRKQRQGPVGEFVAVFDPARMRFDNFTKGASHD